VQFALWIICGLLTGWFMGTVIVSEERDHLMDLVMGLGGGIGGGFVFRATRFGTHANLLYSSVSAILGAIILTSAARFVFGRREYGPTD
jgi:uncharacterized membrane protein YeaQ/YmgE (transglycosylase-associated protein family)